ncbi:MAG TPA: YopX family protein [Ktedonobacteraceae bacterium]|nr:YopX family protein [Ktedonobacteraceae bacterium]
MIDPPYGFSPTSIHNKAKASKAMNNELQFRAWHKDKMYEVVGLDWHPTCLTASLKREDGVVFGEDNYYDGEQSFVLMAYTGHRSIDNHKVYDRDLLRFPNHNQIYEVRWDNQEGAWWITSNGMLRQN